VEVGTSIEPELEREEKKNSFRRNLQFFHLEEKKKDFGARAQNTLQHDTSNRQATDAASYPVHVRM
jgi:hypothetical protein